jgi:hypothetical protein
MRGTLGLAFVALVLLGALVTHDPRVAADGWRAAFLLLSAPPLGAVALLLIAQVVGADWDAALQPLLPAVPWMALLAIPVAIGQALFHWPDAHLHVWLSPPLFAVRSLVALLFWAATARALQRGSVARPGPLLFAHGLIVSVMAYDWLLGAAPAQPNSAAPMMLATMQIGGAAAWACAAGLGRATQRRDLAYLIVAAGIGMAYLLYMDFVIVWFGNLPGHVGWYGARHDLPAALLPGLALALGLLAPALLVGIGRSDRARAWAGGSALLALGLIAVWMVAASGGWIALLAASTAIAIAGGSAKAMVR